MKKFEYNKKTNTLIIFFQEIILKIPLSFRSFKIIRNEIKNYFIIKNDDLFSNNVLNIKSFYFFFQIKKLSKLEFNKKYFF